MNDEKMENEESKTENWYAHQLSPQELKNFIDEAKNGKENKKAYIGKVVPEAAERIKAVCEKNVSNIMIESEGVRHSYKRTDHHLRDDDLLNLAEAINTATDIKISNEKHQNNGCIELSKDIGGKISFVVEVRIHFGGWLALVTCYRQKK